MNEQKKMYKVLLPLEKRGGGGTYWMRLGTAFTNKDDSLNVYLDVPPPQNLKTGRFELHIRELDAEDLRKREAYNSSASSGSSSPRDLGGIGGNGIGNDAYRSRAVTAGSAAADANDIPF